MKLNSSNDHAIAAAITFICVLLLLLFLFFGGMTFERRELSQDSVAAVMEPLPEFYEPELLDAGEEEAVEETAPAPGIQGNPTPSPEPKIAQAASVFPSSKPSPSSLNSYNIPSPAKTDSALADFQEAADALAAKFNPVNGNNPNRGGNPGAGGDATGISGSVKGRSFISCPRPRVTLRHRTVVPVDVTINAEGQVTKATARGAADASIRKKCEEAAMDARWSPKPGAAPASGTITFTITPA